MVYDKSISNTVPSIKEGIDKEDNGAVDEMLNNQHDTNTSDTHIPETHSEEGEVSSMNSDSHFLSSMLNRELKQRAHVKLSDTPWTVRVVGDELGSCQNDSVSVYSRDLQLLRAHSLGRVMDAALLPDDTIVVCSRDGLLKMSKTGAILKEISSAPYMSVSVHGNQCYACPEYSHVITVYACADWHVVRSIRLLGCGSDCWMHTLSVTADTIKVCCWENHQLIKLQPSGDVETVHGPWIERSGGASGAAGAARMSKDYLYGPYLWQEDSASAVLVVDSGNERLLVHSAAAARDWRKVTTEGTLSSPVGAVWWNERLYVSTQVDEVLIMFKWMPQ